jgi:AcrR family transcriptional regulator
MRHYGLVPKTIPKAPGVRARVRAELTAEIKSSARRQLAADGAATLSLRAIAREMNMASSAIYRYFASRDDLLTALIVDAYDSIGSAVEQADATMQRDNCVGRFTAIATSIRDWAHTNPHEYALIYGSPVPGYAAPDDTIDPAVRVPMALISVLVDRWENPDLAPLYSSRDKDAALAAPLAELADFVEGRIPMSVLAMGVRSWGEIFGLVNLELFGHFNNAITDPAAFYAYAIAELADRTLTP